MQSPKSRRQHAPGESPANDNLPCHKTGGVSRNATSGKDTTKAPVKSTTGNAHSTNTPRSDKRSETKAFKNPSGRAGYESGASGDAGRKGGSFHRFPNGSE